MKCPRCGGDGARCALTPGGITRVCAACGTPLESEPAEDPAVSVPPGQRPTKASSAEPQPATRLTPRDVVRQAKRERTALRKSVAAMKRALKRDSEKLAELERLLDAAANRRPAVVRAIRTPA